jgi:chemotaxis protein CheC
VTPLLLSEEKRDALRELVNIGMGTAAAALAAALGAFVELTSPGLEVTDRRSVAKQLDTGAWRNSEIEAVRQPFFGAFTGESLMLFDGPAHAELAGMVGHGSESAVVEQQEVLLDVANVVIGACVNGIAESLAELVSFAPPTRLGTRADVRAFLSREAVAWQQGLIVNVDFKLEARSFLSRVLVFLPEPSMLRIDQAVSRLLDGLAAG